MSKLFLPRKIDTTTIKLNSIKAKKNIEVIDIAKSLYKELFLNTCPEIYSAQKNVQNNKFNKYWNQMVADSGGDSDLVGGWVFHSWSNFLYHLVSKKQYVLLRTARNRNIITEKDQLQLYNKRVAIIGLSVGSNITLSLLRSGVGNYFIVADRDVVEVTNFNRTQYDLRDHLQSKAISLINKVNMIDPYIKFKLFNSGLSEENIDNVIKKCDLVIDLFDDFKLKIKLRQVAAEHRIPVISGFDVEYGFLLIVERYDLHPSQDDSLLLNDVAIGDIGKFTKTDLFINLIGKELHSEVMLKSVKEVGKSLSGYPQLMIATQLAAAVMTRYASKILLGEEIKSFRRYFSLR
ncbi:MAG: ThiF family adenylyltransferase [bacterium]|nr:ThiF family adenylyltransferase [bacterium]